jgi:hypothetical protein
MVAVEEALFLLVKVKKAAPVDKLLHPLCKAG